MAFVPVTAEQVPALRQAGLLWFKHPSDPEFRSSTPFVYAHPPAAEVYQWNINHGTVYAILLEE